MITGHQEREARNQSVLDPKERNLLRIEDGELAINKSSYQRRDSKTKLRLLLEYLVKTFLFAPFEFVFSLRNSNHLSPHNAHYVCTKAVTYENDGDYYLTNCAT